jgi:uncharacterized protein (TIGR02594 family)
VSLSPLPHEYAWLGREPGPRMLVAALERFGVHEIAGGKNDPTIMAWAKEAGVAHAYTADEVPWCGLFMAVCAKRAGWPIPTSPLWALNWSTWGEPGGQPELGDVLTFVRPGGGHVALYVGEDAQHYHVLGGNQGNAVSVMTIAKTRLHACRQPAYTSKPANVRPIVLTVSGHLSVNEE